MTPSPGPSLRLERFDRLLAPVLGGVATLGFAPFHLWPAPILAMAGLWFLASPYDWKRAALLGWLFGFAHFATGIYWIFISTVRYGGAAPWLGLVLCTVLFSYLSLYPALVTGLASKLRLWRSLLGFLAMPSLWVLTELLRGWVYSGFPWLSMGYAGLDTPMEALAPIGGVHAISGVFAATSFAVYRALSFGDGPKVRAVSLVLVFTPAAGLLLPSPLHWTRADGPALSVAVVQGNFSQDVKWLPETSAEILTRYHDLTAAVARGVDLVAWPEAVPNEPYDLVADWYDQLQSEMAAADTTLLGGVLIRDSDTVIYNSMLAIGDSFGRYDKRHLVPFGEYFPIPDWLRPIMDVLGTPYSDFSVGGTRDPVTVRKRLVGVSICFEDVFAGEYARESRSAAFLVNATNDAWFASSAAPFQHFDIARLRALENGRWLVRATNTGISAFIAPDGRVVSRTQLFETAVLRGHVVPRAGLTPYVHMGDGPLWYVCLLFLITAWASASARPEPPLRR